MIVRLFLIGAAALTVAACGRQGDLERPAPLYGEARQRYLDEAAAAQKARDEKAEAGEEEQTSGGEPTRRRVPDRAETLGTTRAAPLEGRPNDPAAPGPR
jgi:predicted small lipoprotein YifL